jgi:pyruvate-ferredoxin/flavodoxin oxidoreductase
VTEARFRKHFRTVPRDAWNDDMVPLHEYLDLSNEDREGKYPYIWAVDVKNRLIRVVVAEPLVKSCEDRRSFWRILKSMAAVHEVAAELPSPELVRAEFAQTVAARLLEWAGNGNLGGGVAVLAPAMVAAIAPAGAANGVAASGAPNGTTMPAASTTSDGYVAPWMDSAQCTSCDECININGKIFAYDDNKHAYIKNAKGGPYKDLVRAAEKCTAQIIHPGTPFDPKEKDAEKLRKRAAKYN